MSKRFGVDRPHTNSIEDRILIKNLYDEFLRLHTNNMKINKEKFGMIDKDMVAIQDYIQKNQHQNSSNHESVMGKLADLHKDFMTLSQFYKQMRKELENEIQKLRDEIEDLKDFRNLLTDFIGEKKFNK